MDNYLGSDQHWIDGVNQRYDEREQHNKKQQSEQVDNRQQCYKTGLECTNYKHLEKGNGCFRCKV